jgi:hypothetical protein
MSVLCEAVVFLLLALPAIAQSQAFEVISIKPARSGDPRNMRMRVLPNGDLDASAVPVLLLLRYAYDVPVNPRRVFPVFRAGARRTTSRRRRPPTPFPAVFQKAKSKRECRK